MTRVIAAGLLLVALAAGGCADKRRAHSAAGAPVPGSSASGAAFRIGIMTGAEQRTPEEFRAAEEFAKRNPGRVRHITFPDDFVHEQETVVAQLTGLAGDPTLRVIVVAPAIPGVCSAARIVRERRPDVLIGLVSPYEEPGMVDGACALAIEPDPIARGAALAQEATAMGARTLVHYSTPAPSVAAMRRRDALERACARRHVAFVDTIAPDPVGGGLGPARTFLREDVPRQLDRRGASCAFFASDGLPQQALLTAVVDYGGYFLEQESPSPVVDFAEVLATALPADAPLDSVHAANHARAAARGVVGHLGTWAAPFGRAALLAEAELLTAAIAGTADVRDSAVVERALDGAAENRPAQLHRDAPGSCHYLVMFQHVVY